MIYACSVCGYVFPSIIVKKHWEMDCSYLSFLPVHNVGIEYGFECPHCQHFRSIGIKIHYTRENKKDTWKPFTKERPHDGFDIGFTIADIPTWNTDKMIKPIKSIKTKK